MMIRVPSSRDRQLTNSRDNLRFHTKLVLEAARKITNTPFAIPNHVWYLADMIEHVPTREEEDSDQADRSPEVSVLNDG